MNSSKLSIENFLKEFNHDQTALQKLFTIITSYGNEFPVENPKDSYTPTPMAEWLTGIKNGVRIYFDYANWFRTPLDDGDDENHFEMLLSRLNYDYDSYTYDVILSEHRNGRTDRGDLPECGIYLQYIDCFCAFNILMNLIDMKVDGKVYDLDIMTHSRKPIPEEEWMREYKHTKMLAKEGIL